MCIRDRHEVVAAVEHVQLLVHGEQGQGNLHVQRAYLLPIEVEGTLRQAHTTAVVQLERGGIRVLALGEGRFRLGHLLHGERRAVREDPAAVLVRERDLREAEPVAQALQRRHDGSRVGRLHLERADGVLHDEDADVYKRQLFSSSMSLTSLSCIWRIFAAFAHAAS